MSRPFPFRHPELFPRRQCRHLHCKVLCKFKLGPEETVPHVASSILNPHLSALHKGAVTPGLHGRAQMPFP